MVKFQAMHKYFAVFLVLVTFHGSLLTHARKIKPLHTNTMMLLEDNAQPTLPPLKTSVNVPTPSSENKVESPMLPKYGAASYGDSGSDTNAFRPTTPGSSPGVGHRNFAGEDNNMKAVVVVKSPDVEVSMTEGINDFRPTEPGNSPGVGHPYQHKN
ncbi:precursor of CEP9-like [Gastrolobium bilobum]|uniref:precursor of CEP9-like n=1 Tax=Gastrolobium bilobum TaxID=150636 RepID=UPI002AB08FED|nr:precursor of CEP9-like [Gastrolobium bilobum]